jgi:hypothetical protein
MIVMEQNMGRALGRLFGIAGEFRVAGEERVDQDDRFTKLDAESRVAEPNEVGALPDIRRDKQDEVRRISSKRA